MTLLKVGKAHFIVFRMGFLINLSRNNEKVYKHADTQLLSAQSQFNCRDNGLGMEITLTKADKWFPYFGKASLLREDKITPAFCLPGRMNAF